MGNYGLNNKFGYYVICCKKTNSPFGKRQKNINSDLYSITGSLFATARGEYEYMNFDSSLYLNKELIDYYQNYIHKFNNIKKHPLENQPRYQKKRNFRQEVIQVDTVGLQKRIQKQVEEGEKKIQEMLELRRKYLVRSTNDSV